MISFGAIKMKGIRTETIRPEVDPEDLERLNPIMERELGRQKTIEAAVEAALAVLQQYFDDNDSNPDVESYLLYKTGANIMMKGLAAIDNRVFINDLTGFQIAEVRSTPVKIKAEEYPPCTCGRKVIGENEHMVFAPPVCVGCFKLPAECTCKKLATQAHAKRSC